MQQKGVLHTASTGASFEPNAMKDLTDKRPNAHI